MRILVRQLQKLVASAPSPTQTGAFCRSNIRRRGRTPHSACFAARFARGIRRDNSKVLQLSLVAVASAALLFSASAETLSGEVETLSGEVEWTSDVSADHELSGNVTITVLSGTVTCSGVLSGSGKLIKKGNGLLILSAANTYTGGTQIDEGKLQADNAAAFGPVNAALPIQVNSDCSRESPTDEKVVALVVNCATFAYPINFSDWADPLKTPEYADKSFYKYLYNLCTCYANASPTLSGKITGGGMSLRVGDLVWGTFNKVKSPTFTGDIDLPNGTIYLANRAVGTTFNCTIKAKRFVKSPNTPPAVVTFMKANDIGEIDVGCHASDGRLTVSAANGIYKAKLISRYGSIYKDDSHFAANIDCGSYAQTIDVPMAYLDPIKSVGVSDAYHRIKCTSTLTIEGSQNATNDWAFVGEPDGLLVWNPTGDYRLLNVSREQTYPGALVISKGTFAIGANCSFLAIASVEIGENATLELADDGVIASTVPVTMTATSKIKVPAGRTVTLQSILRGDTFVTAGPHTDEEWLEGGGCVAVTIRPGAVAKTAQWTGAVSDSLSAEGNWTTEPGAPDLLGGIDTLVFPGSAEGATNATVDTATDVHVGGVEFGSSAGFHLAGTTALGLFASGIALPAAAPDPKPDTVHISAPIKVKNDQTWLVGSNRTLSVTGKIAEGVIVAPGEPKPTLTVRGDGDLYVTAPQTAQAGAFSGDVICGSLLDEQSPVEHYDCTYLHLTGLNPLGTGTIQCNNLGASKSNYGRKLSMYLSDATLENRIVLRGRYAMTFVAMTDTTNCLAGVIDGSAQRFAPNYSIAANAKLVVEQPLNFGEMIPNNLWSISASPSQRAQKKTADLAFNGAITYNHTIQITSSFGTLSLNAPSNHIGAISVTVNDADTTLALNADDALADGFTALYVSGGAKGTNVIDLCGHSQHVGALLRANAYSRFVSTGGPAVLRINQTNDFDYAGTFDANVHVIKEGTGTLTVSGSAPGTLTVADGTLAISARTVAKKKTTVLRVGLNGKIALPSDGTLRVAQLFVENESGDFVEAKAGTYTAEKAQEAFGRAIFADGSGSLRVGPSGAAIIYR